jgi:hypothetical protein
MPRARIDPGRYARRSFAQVLSGPSKSGAGTLVAGVLELFPRADPERLQNWVEGMHRWPGAETDAVLFLALVSGTRFRIYRPRVEEVQEELWSWLTWHPRNMRAGLAEILVSALTPELRRELKAREGWRLGPAGSRGKKL